MSSDKTTDAEALADLVATAAEKAERTGHPQNAGDADDAGDGIAAGADKPQRRRPSRAVLVAAGVGAVGLLAGGGIGYAVGHGGSSSGSGSDAADSSTLALPSTLSGGYKRSTTVDSNIKSATASAVTTLGAGTDMALYTKNKQQVLVEATRLPGRALLQAGMTYSKVGEAVCASASSTSGSEAICSRTNDSLTVKVTGGTSAIASKYADEVFSSLS